MDLTSKQVHAIKIGNREKILDFLQHHAGDASDEHAEDLNFLLGMAAYFGQITIMRDLVAFGANVNPLDNRADNSPLGIAIKAGKKEVIRTLIELGADIPDGVETGLNRYEQMVALQVAISKGFRQGRRHESHPDIQIEEIKINGVFGVDTITLENDLQKYADTSRD